MPFLGPNISALVHKRDLAALLKILQRDTRTATHARQSPKRSGVGVRCKCDVHARHQVIRALGDFGDRAAVPVLTAILASDHPRVSEQIDAAEALGKIADEKNLPDLDELARSGNRIIARLASHAAIEIRQRRQLTNEQT